MQINDVLHGFKRYFLIARGNKSKSYKSVVSTLKLLDEFKYIGGINNHSPHLLEEFLIELSEKRCWSAKTYRNHWQNLKSFFSWCVIKRYINKNPISEVARPKLNKPLPRFVADKDVIYILHATESYPWRYRLERSRNVAIIYTLLFTGIRLQELLDLSVSNVNIIDKEIFIKNGKGGKDRIVPIHNILISRLKEYYEQRKKLLSPSMWFFTSVRSEKQLTQKNILTICNKIREQSKVYFSPHMLRHTFARMVVEAKVNLFTLKEVMGHSSISTTQRYLSISTESMKRQIGEVDFLAGHKILYE